MKRYALGLALLAVTAAAQAQAVCRPDPLGGRSLYLRGSFNSWNATDARRFTWACNAYQLVTRLSGEHRFKIADEAWSADADFGSDPAAPQRVALRGREFERRFDATYRITLAMNNPTQPVLSVEACPLEAAPLGPTALFLRGSMNNWAALDDYAFQFSCDAYYLNVDLKGRHEFKIADAAWKDATSFGAGSGPALKEGGGNLEATFSGEQTLRLAWAGGRPQLTLGPKTFADPNTKAVTDPVALSLRFDSRAATHKAPFGAVTAGSTIAFALDALPGVDKLTLVVEKRRLEGNQEVLEYTELARVPMSKGASRPPVRPEPVEGQPAPKSFDKPSPNADERWSASHRFTDIGVYGYWFEVEIGGKRYAYQNNGDSVFWTREKGSGGLGTVADLPSATSTVRRFRQTVYAADFKVPDWAPDIVYYYIFPDRFRNGDKGNDPRPGVTKFHDGTVELHQRWLDKPWKPGDGSDARYNNDFFGGDLAGIINKLDYIKALGANTIYMTPVFKAASNHKYDTANYKQIDPGFGSNADFERLTSLAARRGIRVILDTSLNHTGQDSLYFDRFGNFGGRGAFANGKITRDSPYASWYGFDATQREPDKQYKGWVGVADLPELNKASPSWRNFAYRDRDSVTKLWLDRGAAGWRMDVAPWVPDDFWREWRTAVKSRHPDTLTVAETWFDASKFLLGDMFDSTMNYIFRNTVQEYAAGGKASKLVPNLELMREAYPKPAFYSLMNLLSSHDQARALHHFGWHDDTQDPAVIALAKQRLKLAVLFQMTYPGAPTVYYGDEVGMTGGDDPYNRGAYPWADLGGKPDTALLADFKQLIKLRHDHAVLRRGSLDAPLYVDEHVIVLAREHQGTWAVTATNNAATARTVTVALPAGAKARYRDALTGGALAAEDGRLTLTVPPLFGSVLISR